MPEETRMTKPNRGFAVERGRGRGKENELILLAFVFATICNTKTVALTMLTTYMFPMHPC